MTPDREADVGGIRSGLLLGTYQLTAMLGERGMGVVFSAVDTKLQRPVAIKFLSNRLADAEGRRRFQREAQVVSSLNHDPPADSHRLTWPVRQLPQDGFRVVLILL